VKSTVYHESSVISYLAARPSRDVVVAARQTISHEWWRDDRHRFELRISALVEGEIGLGDEGAAKRRQDLVAGIPSLAISDEAIELAEALLSNGVIPKGSENDALHVGIAAAQGADFLLTWNFSAHQQCRNEVGHRPGRRIPGFRVPTNPFARGARRRV